MLNVRGGHAAYHEPPRWQRPATLEQLAQRETQRHWRVPAPLSLVVALATVAVTTAITAASARLAVNTFAVRGKNENFGVLTVL